MSPNSACQCCVENIYNPYEAGAVVDRDVLIRPTLKVKRTLKVESYQPEYSVEISEISYPSIYYASSYYKTIIIDGEELPEYTDISSYELVIFPAPTCYCKVWFREDLYINASSPNRELSSRSEGSATFTPTESICLNDKFAPAYSEIQGQVIKNATVELPTANDSERVFYIWKYSYVDGYEPSDPVYGIGTPAYDFIRPNPDPTPNGFPIPS